MAAIFWHCSDLLLNMSISGRNPSSLTILGWFAACVEILQITMQANFATSKSRLKFGLAGVSAR